MSGTRAISTTWRCDLSSSSFFLQGKAPKEIHTILTEKLTCFLPGRAKDLSAPLYGVRLSTGFICLFIVQQRVYANKVMVFHSNFIIIIIIIIIITIITIIMTITIIIIIIIIYLSWSWATC